MEPPVLPTAVDPRSLQRLNEAGFSEFKSLEQYQAYWLLKQRSHHFLYIGGTGSGKTMTFQLVMRSLGPEYQCVLLLPYRSLYTEMENRMRSIGLSAAQYDSEQEFRRTQVVITSPGTLVQSARLRAAIKAAANNNKMLGIIFDEAVCTPQLYILDTSHYYH
jgi:superfamily II DNA or RNA helicase